MTTIFAKLKGICITFSTSIEDTSLIFFHNIVTYKKVYQWTPNLPKRHESQGDTT